MNLRLEELILNNLVHNESYARKALPHLKLDYFSGSDRAVYDLILDFMVKYNRLPNAAALSIEFNQSDKIPSHESQGVLESIENLNTHRDADHQWLLDSTEKWCKDRALYNAIMESITIIDGKNKDGKGEGVIPDLLTKALSVSFDTNVGHDYFENAEERYKFYHTTETKIPFDLEMFNTITNGGVTRKTLNMFLGGTNVGKSLVLCHLAAANLMMGRNVLYITLEMAEERIAERIDANLFNVPISDLGALQQDAFFSKVRGLVDKTKGRLIIKEYPTSSAHVGHFRALLHELKLKKNFIPDVVYIDYVNICASSRIKSIGGNANSYTIVKAIAEELRGLAVEFNIPIWSATQTTRAGMNNSDVDITETSESWGLPQTADLFLAIISTEQLEKMGQYMVKQLKSRYGDKSNNKRFVIGVDRSKMRLYDVNDPSANLIADSKPAQNQTPFLRNASRARPNLSGIQV